MKPIRRSPIGSAIWTVWVLKLALTGAALASEGLLIVYTNDTAGYLEPCGCQSGQPGGLARRATAIQRLRTSRPLLLLDSGNLVASDPDRAAVILEAMRRMGYSHVGLGPLELTVGEQLARLARLHHLQIVSFVPAGQAGWPNVVNSDLRQVGAVSVGIVGVGAFAQEIAPEQIFEGLLPTLQQVRSESQIVVLLSQLGLPANRRLAELQGETHLIDLVIGGRDAVSLAEPLVVGKTYLLPGVDGTRQIGVVTVTFGENGTPRFACRRILLDHSFVPDGEVQQLINAYYAGEARRLMEQSATVAEDPAAQKYAAVEKCAECHRPQWEQWQAQKHAQAIETLQKADRLVPECLPCHSEQYRRTNLFKPVGAGVSASPLPRDGVTCTTCHGDGVVHSLLGRQQVVTRDGGEALCRQCHDAEHDPQFDYAKAKEGIRHW